MGLSVSVIVPVYNAERFLDECVGSVVAQADSGVGEILLVDDGSTDGSLDLARSLAARHGKLIKVLTHPDGGNHRVAATRNLGIERAACPLVAFLDADDHWLPGRLAGALPILESRPEVDAVYDMWTHEGDIEDGTDIFQPVMDFPRVPATEDSRRTFFAAFMDGRLLWHVSSIVLRRAAFERCGTFDGRVPVHEDTHLWMRVAAMLAVVRSPLDRPVACYRRHDANRFDPRKRYEEPWETIDDEERRRRDFSYWTSLVTFFEEHAVPFAVWRPALKPYLQAAGRAGSFAAPALRALRHGSPLQIRHILRWAWRTRRRRTAAE